MAASLQARSEPGHEPMTGERHSNERGAQRARVASSALAVLLALLAGATARAGDYHSGLTLRCSDCHIMHYSQAHDLEGPFVGFMGLGAAGPYRSLLRNQTNDLCLACHDGNVIASDVLGAVNAGSQGGIVRSSGYLTHLLMSGETHTGHTLESMDDAPGSQPVWNAQVENGLGEGLTCVNCHSPHGDPGGGHPTGSQFRNLRSDPGHSASAWVTYNQGAPGLNDPTRDVFLRAELSYDETQLDWNEPDSNDAAIARWCGGCHTYMHGNGLGVFGGGGGFTNEGLGEHPVWGENLETDMVARYNALTNRVKVMSEIGTWFPISTDATPTCITCHRSHGNGRNRGLIFRSGTGTPTEDGDTGGTSQADLCLQCHDSGTP